MTPDREDTLRVRDIEALTLNARGVALAAFGSIGQIAALLGVDTRTAQVFQFRARDDFELMQIEAGLRRPPSQTAAPLK